MENKESVSERYNILFRRKRLYGTQSHHYELNVSKEDVCRLGQSYCNRSKNWFHNGVNYPLEAISPEIYQIDWPTFEAYASKKLGKRAWQAVSKLDANSLVANVFERLYIVSAESYMSNLGDNVTNQFILGGYGSKKIGAETLVYVEQAQPRQVVLKDSKAEAKETLKQPLPTDGKKEGSKPIFISHASKDSDLATHFVKYYLRDGLEVPMDQVFYSSHAATGIGVGDDFRDTIKQALKEATVVILLISENFKLSQYCIAEMGAAWALDKVMIPICIPPFDRVSSGQLLGPLQYIDVNNRLGLTGLRDQLVKKHRVGKIGENSMHWQEALEDFIGKAEKKIGEIEAGKK
jgi:hypothetical protein